MQYFNWWLAKMRYLDKVKVLNDSPEYTDAGIFKNTIGTIISAEIRDNCFLVIFVDKKMQNDDISIPIKIEDLELVEDNHTTDEIILDDLPLHNTDWWCIVENGFIKNLKGENKNQIPFDYDS